MRIGLDARTLASPTLTGVGLVVYQTVKFLLENEVDVTLFFDQEPSWKILNSPGITKVVLPGKKRFIWEQFSLGKALLDNQVDLFHAPWNHGIPLIFRGPSILTIHDLIPLILPESFNTVKRPWITESAYKLSLHISVAKANKIITVSNWSKQDIISLLGIPSDKIEVVYNGFNNIYHPIKDRVQLTKIKGKYGLSPETKYFIYVGGLDPRKNIEGIIEAFAKIKPQTVEGIKVLITGKINNLQSVLIEKARNLGIGEDIIFTGYVSEEELNSLLSGSIALVYPSYYEGFGIPLLEGMASGTPVITSNTSSIPEIVGDAAILVNPHDKDQIASAMWQMYSKESLRQELIKKGIERVEFYSWEKMARRVYQIYLEVLNSR